MVPAPGQSRTDMTPPDRTTPRRDRMPTTRPHADSSLDVTRRATDRVTRRVARTLVIAGAAAILAMPSVAGAAQEDAGLFPITPTADNCVVATPRTVEDISAILAAGDAVATPETSLISEGAPVTNVPSSAAPADDATIAAVTATLVTWYGCVNSGNLLAAAALETDGLIAQQAATGLSLSNLELAEGTDLITVLSAPPVPLEGADAISIVDVRDVVVFRTGDVRATVEHTVSGSTETVVDTVSFTRSGDTFVIAGAVLGTTGDASPAASRPPRR
jgi:hypothetical protein